MKQPKKSKQENGDRLNSQTTEPMDVSQLLQGDILSASSERLTLILYDAAD